jgi:4-coumarate--CoA ligase
MDYSVPLLGAVAAGKQKKKRFIMAQTYTYTILGGSTTPANPAYTPNELAYQLEMTKAKVLIAHPTNVDSALAAAELVGLPKSNVFVFGNQAVQGCLPYTQILLGQRRIQPIELSAQETKETVAYLCFSSGTTGTVFEF